MTELFFRFVEPEDSDDLLRWRNDPITRKYAFDTTKVSKKNHIKWFNSSLVNPKRNIFIIMDKKGNKLGQVRFDKTEDFVEVDIAIDPDFRRKGIGTMVLEKSSRFYFDNFDVNYIIAKIKEGL